MKDLRSAADPSSAAHGRIVTSEFRPHPLLRGAHAQTIAPTLLRPRPALALRIERRETPDRDFVDLGWAGEHHRRGPLATLVHGLGGGFDSKYLRGLAQQLVAHGWRVVVLQLRGGGREANRLPVSYHQGHTRDLRWLWRQLRKAERSTPIVAVGWSLGGNLLLRALAEEGTAAPVAAAVAACVPFDLQRCAEHMNRGFPRVYQAHLLKELHRLARRKLAAGRLPASIDAARVLTADSFLVFDDAFTAPVNGFASARDYYAQTSSGAILDRVHTPTLIVQAADDPFMGPDSLPDASRLSPALTLEVAAGGGHVGFVGAGRGGRLDWWLERRIAGHLQQLRAGF